MSSVELTPEYELCPSDLQWPVESVSEDFTLFDLFRLIHHAQQDCPQLPDMLGMAYFDAFYEEATREPKPSDGLHYLELYWHIDYDAIQTKKKGGKRAIYQDSPIRGDMPNLMGFHGIGEHQCAFEGSCPNGCPETDRYAIEMTPVNELVHLPIRMNPEVGMYEPWITPPFTPSSPASSGNSPSSAIRGIATSRWRTYSRAWRTSSPARPD